LGVKSPEKEPPAQWGLKRNCPSANVLLAYVNEQVQVLTEQDPRVRAGSPDSVHLMRIATRRLRSALSTYRILLDADLATRLRAELQWLGSILGAHRDAEVMHQRLTELIAAEPTKLILGPMLSRVDERLETDSRNARRNALEALGDDRYFRLLDGLDALLTAPPLTDLASIPERKIVPKLVETEWKRLRRAVRTAVRTPAGIGHDQALHEVRKSAKRLRYAAETATPLHRKRATRIAGAAEKIQTILGDHQDSVLAQGLLRQLGMEAHLQGENVFSYGRLNALEQQSAERSEIHFRRAWNRFPSTSLKK
jgi:CHAD domain-containing protein